MDYNYSNTMKALMKNKPGLAIKIILLVLIALAALGSISSVLSERNSIEEQKANVQEFDPFGLDQSYSKLTPQFLSEEYATNYNDTVYYCLAIDTDYNTYIVAINADDMDKYQSLIDYTYDESIMTPPEEVVLQGTPEKIEEDLVGYTVEGYNAFWGEALVDSSNYELSVGSYYLDTTQGPATESSGFAVFLALAIVLLLIYALLMTKSEKAAKIRKATLQKYNYSILGNVDQELNQPDTLHYDKQGVHLTNHYIVSSANGFDIIPYEELKQIFGLIKSVGRNGNQRAVVAITMDEVQHEVAYIGMGNDQDVFVEQIVERIKAAVPDIMYGTDGESFYIIDSKNSGTMFDTEVEEEEGSRKSNVLFGIVGALAGAAIGGVIWIVIGELGFIAGLAGFFMMTLAIKGYRMLSGYLDKKGQIIALVIALFMIFVSNYLLYALEYCKGYYDSNYSLSNIIASIKALPDFLKIEEVRLSFFKDLAIGYLLSIWSGFRIIKSVFSGKSNKE